MFSVLKLVKDFRIERHASVVGETYNNKRHSLLALEMK